MARHINISQSVDPNTLVLDIHEEHRTHISVLISRSEGEAFCDKLRALLSDQPTLLIPGPRLAIFPAPEERPMTVGIAHKYVNPNKESR